PGGGRFRFRVRLTNTGDEAVTVSGGTAVYLPGGAIHGPLLARSGVVVPAHASVVGTFRQQVPAYAPPGAYEYVVYTGVWPAFEQTASFPFTKEAPTAATSREVSAGVAGWMVEEVGAFAVEGAPAVASAVEIEEGAVMAVGSPHPNPSRGYVAVPVRLSAVAEV